MLFDRIVRVDIGKPGQIGTRFEDIRITFNGEKSNSIYANKCEVDLYNINQDTVKQITDDNNVLILSCGYSENKGLQVLFSGDITRVIPIYEPPDIITRIECFNGLKKLQQNRIALGYAPGVSVDTIVKQFVRALELPLAESYTPITETFSNGFNYIGEVRKGLTIVLKKVDKEWSIQDGAVQIMDDDGVTKREIIVISPDSGLIGIPENLDEKAGRLSRVTRKRKKKYRITSLLRPELKINDRIQIVSNTVEGLYKIRRHEYEGDNFGDEWTSTFEVREI